MKAKNWLLMKDMLEIAIFRNNPASHSRITTKVCRLNYRDVIAIEVQKLKVP
jgi:hypothetical protein